MQKMGDGADTLDASNAAEQSNAAAAAAMAQLLTGKQEHCTSSQIRSHARR